MIEPRHCPAPDCGVPIHSSRFACRSHWFSLTRDTRRRINEAFADFMDGEATLGDLQAAQAVGLAELGSGPDAC